VHLLFFPTQAKADAEALAALYCAEAERANSALAEQSLALQEAQLTDALKMSGDIN
jgi:hypothetical protein